MGNAQNHKKWWGKLNRKVVVLGFENSGKSCFVSWVKDSKFFSNYVPNLEVEIQELHVKNQKWVIYDCPGSERQRVFWRHNYRGAQGIVFIVDTTNTDEQLKKIGETMKELFSERAFSDSCFTVFLNKIDITDEYKIKDKILKKLGCELCQQDSRVKFVCSSLKTGEGVKEGIDWLYENMKPI